MKSDNINKEVEDVKELRKIISDDIPIYLCGRKSSLDEIESIFVCEMGAYTHMADFVTDESGSLIEVNYDIVGKN